MAAPPSAVQGVDKAAAPDVLARIEARPSGLASAIAGWETRLRARKLKARSIPAYVSVVRAAVRDAGWGQLEDLSYESISGYMAAKVEAGEWKGGTFNRNLTVFKSFSRHVSKVRGVADPMADADRSEEDADDTIRALTLEEARRLVQHAWMRSRVSAKASLESAVSLAFIIAHGSRPGEPDQLRWEHLHLAHAHPHIRWTRDINKNRRDQLVALTPELAGLLLEHRERQMKGPGMVLRPRRGRPAVARRVDPREPTAFVFAEVISRTTFRKYLAQCALDGTDEYGKRLAPKSARKYFKTEALRRKLGGDMVRRLMRHSPHADERYFDPSLEEMAAAAAVMPRIWPQEGAGPVGPVGGVGVVDKRAIDRGGNVCSLTAGAAEGTHVTLPQPVLCPGGASSILSSLLMSREMPRTALISGVDRDGLADLFGALERLLRSGAAHGQSRPTGQPPPPPPHDSHAPSTSA